MAQLAAVLHFIDGKVTAMLFIYRMFRQHELPLKIISDRDPRFTGKFWTYIFKMLGTRLDTSTEDLRRSMVKLSDLIASSTIFFRSVCAESPKKILGARCSLPMSLR